MTDPTDERPKPMSYGFDDELGDLSGFKPSPRKSVKTKAGSKPKPKKVPSKASGKGTSPRPAVLKQRDKAADKIAKSLGFASREAAAPLLLKKRRRTQHDEPVDQLSIRGPVRILNDFISHCENEGVSYWEGLEQLLSEYPIHISSKK